LNWAYEVQKVSSRAHLNCVIRDRSVDDNDIIIRLYCDSRRSKQFGVQGEGITSTGKRRVIFGQAVLTE
jgi:hypothetical protein